MLFKTSLATSPPLTLHSMYDNGNEIFILTVCTSQGDFLVLEQDSFAKQVSRNLPAMVGDQPDLTQHAPQAGLTHPPPTPPARPQCLLSL